MVHINCCVERLKREYLKILDIHIFFYRARSQLIKFMWNLLEFEYPRSFLKCLVWTPVYPLKSIFGPALEIYIWPFRSIDGPSRFVSAFSDLYWAHSDLLLDRPDRPSQISIGLTLLLDRYILAYLDLYLAPSDL